MPDAGIRSLAWATDIDVLPLDATTTRGEGYWTVRSPSNPTHYWGNFLLFDEPPRPGDRSRWEACFAAELAAGATSAHIAFGWDRIDGATGVASSEFVAAGYELEPTVALVARPRELRPHARANLDVVVRPLDARPGADEDAWAQVIELWVTGRDPSFEESEYRPFARSRLTDLRGLFVAGRGAWWVAELPRGEVAGSLGIVVTGTRARFQTVDTAERHRRHGICSRLVVEAAQRTVASDPVEHFVICADPDYHALGLYESLGFFAVERVTGVLRRGSNS
jgi:ribosomal protein S18 acetylase RimI-like enzyme